MSTQTAVPANKEAWAAYIKSKRAALDLSQPKMCAYLEPYIGKIGLRAYASWEGAEALPPFIIRLTIHNALEGSK
jgi:hypothetical protein